MNQVDVVFIVLVYRNFADLKDFKDSIQSNVDCTTKVVVVDAYYDERTSSTIREYANKNSFEYILIENKGYSYGNNVGIEYALKNFMFKYLIICNPDVVVKSLISIEKLYCLGKCIAPRIITRKGNNQNPFWPFKSKVINKFMYIGYKHDIKFILYLGIALNKLYRIIFKMLNHIMNYRTMYACHGSFVIMSNDIIEQGFRYDNNMFLFFEEAVHANSIQRMGEQITYSDEIIVYHKEDGSMNISNIKEYPLLKESYVYYYEKYIKN